MRLKDMRLKTVVAAGTALLLATGLLAGPAPARARKIDGQVTASYIVETPHGSIYVEAVHPTAEGEVVKGPAILTYSPYSVLGRNRDAATWVPRGIHRIYADVVGTGNSGGCWDYGGKREKETGYDLVEWIAKQDWSNGKVAMMGASYDGTTATATAVMRPPHLTTIVPQVAIARWYDYAYSGGIRYFLTNEMLGYQGAASVTDTGFDTPLLLDFGLALPPPVDVQSEDWAERVQSTIVPCDELEHTMQGYDFDTPDYNDFWLERDYLKDAHKIDIPVLVTGSWGDWNVKQEESWLLYNALDNADKRVLYMASRWTGHDLPGGDYDKFLIRWMDHYLLGKDNGIDRSPSIFSETADKLGNTKWTSYAKMPKVHKIVLYAQNSVPLSATDYGWKLLPTKPFGSIFGPPAPAKFPSTSINTEAHAAHHGRSNHDGYWFETPILKRDLRIFGPIEVQVYLKAERKWVTLTPSILDVNPADHTTVGSNHALTCMPTDAACTSELLGVTRGWLDSRYRKGLDRTVEVEPGKPFQLNVATKPQDYVFRKGHYIGLNIQTKINEWSIPKVYPGCENPDQALDTTNPSRCVDIIINWLEGRTRLILPVLGGPKNPNKIFDVFGGHDHG